MSAKYRPDHLRTVHLTPYCKGMGPSFTLTMWATNRTDNRGQTRIVYSLRMHEHGKTSRLFSGDDFCGSPLHADDSDQTVAALLNFLTLRPGDTDAEYFKDYTPEQMAYCEQHAEYLALESMNRFGEEN